MYVMLLCLAALVVVSADDAEDASLSGKEVDGQQAFPMGNLLLRPACGIHCCVRSSDIIVFLEPLQ